MERVQTSQCDDSTCECQQIGPGHPRAQVLFLTYGDLAKPDVVFEWATQKQEQGDIGAAQHYFQKWLNVTYKKKDPETIRKRRDAHIALGNILKKKAEGVEGESLVTYRDYMRRSGLHFDYSQEGGTP